jgi:hypothetical protein
MLPRMRVEQACGRCQHLWWRRTSSAARRPRPSSASSPRNSEHGLRAARPRRPHAPELDCGRALQAMSAWWGKDFIRGAWGGLAMTDGPVVGFTLLGLACWFGFLYLLLYLLSLSASMPP